MNEYLFSVVAADPLWICGLTGTWPWWWAWCRCSCWALPPCYRWRTEAEASGTSCKTPEGCSRTPAWPPAGPTWLRSSCRESCCPGSIAETETETPDRGGTKGCRLGGESAHRWRQIYLKDAGAVFKGVWVADIIDQADDVTGQFHIGQVVKVWEDFTELRRENSTFVTPAIMFGDRIPAGISILKWSLCSSAYIYYILHLWT